jgi:hypothetical protein
MSPAQTEEAQITQSAKLISTQNARSASVGTRTISEWADVLLPRGFLDFFDWKPDVFRCDEYTLLLFEKN